MFYVVPTSLAGVYFQAVAQQPGLNNNGCRRKAPRIGTELRQSNLLCKNLGGLRDLLTQQSNVVFFCLQGESGIGVNLLNGINQTFLTSRSIFAKTWNENLLEPHQIGFLRIRAAQSLEIGSAVLSRYLTRRCYGSRSIGQSCVGGAHLDRSQVGLGQCPQPGSCSHSIPRFQFHHSAGKLASETVQNLHAIPGDFLFLGGPCTGRVELILRFAESNRFDWRPLFPLSMVCFRDMGRRGGRKGCLKPMELPHCE
mmetsp:Transcript_9047/g.25069  ORF Transcript_9047/g.25069 Transcript_9047/m.25069 type:complete len:254 (-) Transcript_9047:287-1048(-)